MKLGMIGNKFAKRKLTEDDVIMIRQLNRDGNNQIAEIRTWSTAKALADKFGVHHRNIEKILNYTTWRNVS